MTDMERLEALKKSDKLFLIPAEVAEILHCAPDLIRVAARQKPELLGFPVTVIGTRTRIPRIPFVQYVEGTWAQTTD